MFVQKTHLVQQAGVQALEAGDSQLERTYWEVAGSEAQPNHRAGGHQLDPRVSNPPEYLCR